LDADSADFSWISKEISVNLRKIVVINMTVKRWSLSG